MVLIRTATLDDASRLHELHTSSIRAICAGHYSRDIVEGWLLHRSPAGYAEPIERKAVFVAELNGEVVGFGEAAAGVIVAVYVDPSAIGQGVGRAILAHALNCARRDHAGPIRLESTLNACGFYKRHGFIEVKRATVKRNHVEVAVVVMEHVAG